MGNSTDKNPDNTDMSEWIKLERLSGNDLPLPRYETPMSAGIDFAACLKRPCFKIGQNKEKSAFIPGSRFEEPIRNSLSKEQVKTFDDNHQDLIDDGTPKIIMPPGEVIMIPLGFKAEFGHYYVLHLHVRSSVGLLGLTLANGTGIVDPDYRGELFAAVFNRSQHVVTIEHGYRLAQGVLLRFEQAVILEGSVDKTERGEGGFGSTGIKAATESAKA